MIEPLFTADLAANGRERPVGGRHIRRATCGEHELHPPAGGLARIRHPPAGGLAHIRMGQRVPHGPLGGGAARAGSATGEAGGPGLQPPRGGDARHAHGGGGEVVRHRGREPGLPPGAILDRPPAGPRRGRAPDAAPRGRRRRRDDARRDARLRRPAHARPSVRLARSTVPGRKERDDAHHDGRLANERVRSDAGDLRTLRARDGALRGAGGVAGRGRDGGVPHLVQRTSDDRPRIEGRRRALLVRDDPPLRRWQRTDRSRRRGHGVVARGRDTGPLLQHVVGDRGRAARLLRRARIRPTRGPRPHPVAHVVPRVSRPDDRAGGHDPRVRPAGRRGCGEASKPLR